MSDLKIERSTENALEEFATQPLKVVAKGLFNALDHAGKKTIDLKSNGLEGFCAMFDPDGRLKRKTGRRPILLRRAGSRG